MQAPRSSLKDDVAPGGVVFERGGAVPDARPAVDALVPIELRDAGGSGCEGLAGTHFDAHLRGTALAKIGIDKVDVIGEARRGLDFTAEQERVLVRHEQFAVVRDGRPAATVHQSVMRCESAGAAIVQYRLELGG